MRVQRLNWAPDNSWSEPLMVHAHLRPQLVLSFGPVDAPPADWFDSIRSTWPDAHHVYCSGGGQVADGLVDDTSTFVTLVEFTGSTVHPVIRHGAELSRSEALGREMGADLAAIDGLRHVLVFAEGLSLNGAAFVNGINATLPDNVQVSGGLASNGTELTRSVVGLNAAPQSGTIVALGLVGESLRVGTGSEGGWDYFGPERLVTRSEGTVVHELDGEKALDVYKRYLGEFARELPGTALMFPLAVWPTPNAPLMVRTILAIDEDTGALRFAGDIPQGSTVRLMRTTTDKLVHGASHAARIANDAVGAGSPALTLCVSCIGRRAVMRSRVEEELDEVVLSSGGAPVVGFYSNGEIAPPSDGREFARAVLHNQTMTVTTLAEWD